MQKYSVRPAVKYRYANRFTDWAAAFPNRRWTAGSPQGWVFR